MGTAGTSPISSSLPFGLYLHLPGLAWHQEQADPGCFPPGATEPVPTVAVPLLGDGNCGDGDDDGDGNGDGGGDGDDDGDGDGDGSGHRNDNDDGDGDGDGDGDTWLWGSCERGAGFWHRASSLLAGASPHPPFPALRIRGYNQIITFIKFEITL